jgi:hypothetical protein
MQVERVGKDANLLNECKCFPYNQLSLAGLSWIASGGATCA